MIGDEKDSKQNQAKEHYDLALTCLDKDDAAFIISTIKESKEGDTVSLIWQGNYRQLAKMFANVIMQEFEDTEDRIEFCSAILSVVEHFEESRKKRAEA